MSGTIWLMAVRVRGLGKPPFSPVRHSDLTFQRQEKECFLRPGRLSLVEPRLPSNLRTVKVKNQNNFPECQSAANI